MTRVCDDSVFEDFEGIHLPGPSLPTTKASAGSSKKPVISVPAEKPVPRPSKKPTTITVSPLHISFHFLYLFLLQDVLDTLAKPTKPRKSVTPKAFSSKQLSKKATTSVPDTEDDEVDDSVEPSEVVPPKNRTFVFIISYLWP